MALKPNDPNATTDAASSEVGKPSAEDEVIIREIDEAVRKDDAVQFAQKYGLVIGGLIAVLLLGLGGYLFWDSQNESRLEEQSEAIVAALDSVQAGDYAAADEKVAPLVDSEEAGVRTTAKLLQAAAALEQEDVAKASEIYAQIAADTEAPPALRDLALIREVSANFDESDPADVIAKLAGLAQPGNAFFGSAAELTAIAHLEAGNEAEAGALFAQIAKDEELPETLRSRARQMAGLLGVDAIEDVEKLLEDEGVVQEEDTSVLENGNAGASEQ
ncbi:MAG: tetratricopeptide repeat protein [Pseudomonadota bacterium]